MIDIEIGDTVEYARSKWTVVDITHGLALIEDQWDTKAVPTTLLKKVEPA